MIALTLLIVIPAHLPSCVEPGPVAYREEVNTKELLNVKEYLSETYTGACELPMLCLV